MDGEFGRTIYRFLLLKLFHAPTYPETGGSLRICSMLGATEPSPHSHPVLIQTRLIFSFFHMIMSWPLQKRPTIQVRCRNISSTGKQLSLKTSEGRTFKADFRTFSISSTEDRY